MSGNITSVPTSTASWVLGEGELTIRYLAYDKLGDSLSPTVVIPIRGEDYPSLAAVWENDEDDAPPADSV